MEIKGCATYIENKKGDFYLVELSKGEQLMIINLIYEMHGNKIKAFKGKQPLTRIK